MTTPKYLSQYQSGYSDGWHGLKGAPCQPPTLTTTTYDQDKAEYMEGFEKGQQQRLINILKK